MYVSAIRREACWAVKMVRQARIWSTGGLFPLCLAKIYNPAMWPLSKRLVEVVCTHQTKGRLPQIEKIIAAVC